MSSGSIKDVINKMNLQIIYIQINHYRLFNTKSFLYVYICKKGFGIE